MIERGQPHAFVPPGAGRASAPVAPARASASRCSTASRELLFEDPSSPTEPVAPPASWRADRRSAPTPPICLRARATPETHDGRRGVSTISESSFVSSAGSIRPACDRGSNWVTQRSSTARVERCAYGAREQGAGGRAHAAIRPARVNALPVRRSRLRRERRGRCAPALVSGRGRGARRNRTAVARFDPPRSIWSRRSRAWLRRDSCNHAAITAGGP